MCRYAEDCVGDWGPWGKCAGGVRSRNFSVYKAARGSGGACEASAGDSAAEECNYAGGDTSV